MGFILALLFAIITVAIGNSKGYSGVGCFFAGLFLGPVAIIILAFLPDKIEQEKERERERETARSRAQEQSRKINELERQVREIDELKQKLRELEAAQASNTSAEVKDDTPSL